MLSSPRAGRAVVAALCTLLLPAVAEECQAYRECGSYLAAYGDHVIEIEYPDGGGERNFELACRLRGSRISIVYRDRNVTPAGRPGFIERRCA